MTVDLQRAPTSPATSATPDQVDDLFSAIGAIDGLVNNAALLVDRQPYDEIPLDEWDRMFAVNVRGSFLCARGRCRGDGHGRRQHRQRRVGDGAHRLARVRALRRDRRARSSSMTRALANELGPREHQGQLRRSRLHPDAGVERARGVRPDAHAAGRVMRPDDLLGTFCYLLSDDSAFVSGQTIVVNGGRVPH